jgi:DNA-binding NarL/FixJ family response regulator
MCNQPCGTEVGSVQQAAGWPVTGRTEELKFVAAALVSPPNAGVLIAGGVGVGKSRLAREALAEAEASGACTVIAAATKATASIPFATFAPFLGDVPEAAGRLGLFRGVCDRLVDHASGRALVVGVDDAHLLDEGTSALVLHLATTRVAQMVVTVRSGEQCPDAVVALWKDGLLERLDLSPLSVTEATDMAEAHLGGPLDRDARRWIVSTSDGSPLYVRELVSGALESGALSAKDGTWRLRGTPRPSQRLVDLVALNLGGLDAAERHAIEVVAVAEPLELVVLEQLADASTLPRLERRGLVAMTSTTRDTTVRCAHPLYAEVLVSTIGIATARALRTDVADALERVGADRPGRALRVATWRLDGDGTTDVPLLTTAAKEALARFDFSLAARLAEAALSAGGGVRSAWLLATARLGAGDREGADATLAAWEGKARDEREGARYVMYRIRTLYWALGELDGLKAFVDRAQHWWTTDTWNDFVAAVRTYLLREAGQYRDAVALGRPLLDRPESHRAVRLFGPAEVAFCLFQLGHIEQARDIADRTIEDALTLNATAGGPSWHVIRTWVEARIHAGTDWNEVHDFLVRLQAVITNNPTLFAGMAVMMQGRVALFRGQIDVARRLLTEAARQIDEAGDPMFHFSWCLRMLGQADALAGDLNAAAAAQARAEQVRERQGKRSRDSVERLLTEVWIAATGREFTRARELALATADEQGESIIGEATFLHAAVRLGAPTRNVVSRMQAVCEQTDSALLRAYAEHVAALDARDGVALDAAAATFEAIGVLLHAADAYRDAAVAHDECGRQASARASTAHRARLLRECEGVRVEAVVGLPEVKLSSREREVALLAARGLSNLDIAERLTLSVRTVESHVYRACVKLGVGSREDLAQLVS